VGHFSECFFKIILAITPVRPKNMNILLQVLIAYNICSQMVDLIERKR